MKLNFKVSISWPFSVHFLYSTKHVLQIHSKIMILHAYNHYNTKNMS